MDEKQKKKDNQLKRGLNRRHLQMIAIGGSIGTGLFLAMGGTIRSAGPGGAMVGYAIMGIIVYCMMTALGELATEYPVPGAFTAYANRFIDPAWGFTNGWSYWFGSSMTVAAELIAGSIIVKYWFPGTSSALWAALFLAVLLALNLFSVKGFGEAEFWFAGIKVVVTVIFLIVGVLMIIGIMHSGEDAGFHNWTLDAGADGKAPFLHGFGGIVGILLVAAFSFSNTELVGLSAAESANPKEDVPKSIHSVFWRLMIFYLGTIFVVATLIPFTEPSLQGMYAIGSGGLFGKGLGASVQKLGYVPEAQNDFIFTIICEELGLFGAICVILLFILLIWRCMVIANSAPDLYASLIAVGVMGHIALQVVLNICVVTNWMPNTGIILPFISYGGTSVAILLSEMGLVLNVSRQIRFDAAHPIE